MLKILRRQWHVLTADWQIYLEEPIPLEELSYTREQASIPHFSFFLLLAMASLIASIGLLSNSTATIIGAMIVAPLMNPILSVAFGIITGDWVLYRRSLWTLLMGTLFTILIAYGISALLGVTVVGTEILSRTEPTLLDLVVAIAAGAAGAFSMTRRSIANSIAGVAIAVALVPPLCTVGIGLQMGQNASANLGILIGKQSIAQGAFLLYLTNLVGITAAACVVFVCLSYGRAEAAIRGIFNWLIILALISWPLSGYFEEFVITNQIRHRVAKLNEQANDVLAGVLIRSLNVDIDGQIVNVEVMLTAPNKIIDKINIEQIHQKLIQNLYGDVQELHLRVRAVPVQIIDFEAGFSYRQKTSN
ncbi:MAG: DUF389 domain-containing protein [Cyanobacteria bacterium P01_H01_bin.15]